MPVEIEYKFLVNKTAWHESAVRKDSTVMNIEQGYIATNPEAVVRVRIKDQKAYLTIKGKAEGATRPEFEYEIPYKEAQDLLGLCKRRIQKKRYLVPYKGHLWEVDEFTADNAPLLLAEIELNDPTESFEKPPWVMEDVTDDYRYSNSSLSLNPYPTWGTST